MGLLQCCGPGMRLLASCIYEQRYCHRVNRLGRSLVPLKYCTYSFACTGTPQAASPHDSDVSRYLLRLAKARREGFLCAGRRPAAVAEVCPTASTENNAHRRGLVLVVLPFPSFVLGLSDRRSSRGATRRWRQRLSTAASIIHTVGALRHDTMLSVHAHHTRPSRFAIAGKTAHRATSHTAPNCFPQATADLAPRAEWPTNRTLAQAHCRYRSTRGGYCKTLHVCQIFSDFSSTERDLYVVLGHATSKTLM